jgi:hypothetical protein
MNPTQIVLAATIVGLIAYDVFAGVKGLPTESNTLRDWSENWTVLAYAAGFLLGHWFGPRQGVGTSVWYNAMPVLFGLLAGDILWQFVGHGAHPWWRYSLWYALAGIPCGMYLWGQVGSWSPIP